MTHRIPSESFDKLQARAKPVDACVLQLQLMPVFINVWAQCRQVVAAIAPRMLVQK